MSAPLARRRVAVAGGGTAGHILTALEILPAYRRAVGCEGIYIGSERGLESRLVADGGEHIELIPALPWAREGWLGKLRGIGSFVPAFLQVRRILLRERIELVIGTGGYASVAPCLAARALGLRVAIHEANAVPGLANRCLARLADVICVDSKETARHFGSGRVAITGTPCYRVRQAEGVSRSPFRIVVLGGSEGSPWLNERVPELMAELRRRSDQFTVHHLTGMEDPTATQAAYERAGVSARVEGWVSDMRPIYEEAAFAIACPGARTLAELAGAGIPALLSPLTPVAHGHHEANARLYAERTGARFVSRKEWDAEKLAAWIHSLLSNTDALRAMGQRARLYSQPDAADAIVRAAEALFERGPSVRTACD